jgi:ABC-type glutathione transport system ATPase component
MTVVHDDNLLSMSDLSLSIADEDNHHEILKSLNFVIRKGEILGLVGESGSGKTMTMRCILRLLEQYNDYELSGKIIYHRDNVSLDIVRATQEALSNYRRNEVSMIFQQSVNVLNPTISIGNQIQERIHLIDEKQNASTQDSVYALLEEVKLSPGASYYKLYPHQLSGGQLQRVLIAMALSNDPHLLLADEPTYNLDDETQKSILELLVKIQKNRGLSILLVSHNKKVISNYCNRYISIQNGELIENCESEAITHVERVGNNELAEDELLVRLRNISKSYNISRSYWTNSKRREVLDNYNLDIVKGRITGLVGPSGCGKSTIAKIIAGIDHEYKGEYLYGNTDTSTISQSENHKMKQRIQVIFQDSYSAMPPHLTVKQLFNDVINAHQLSLSNSEIIGLLAQFSLGEEVMDRLPNQLSGGQRQRILIAKAMIVKPELLICDEIVSSLDDVNKKLVIDALLQLNDIQGLTIFMISHDIHLIESICYKYYTMGSLV